jgi:hypothetical protein
MNAKTLLSILCVLSAGLWLPTGSSADNRRPQHCVRRTETELDRSGQPTGRTRTYVECDEADNGTRGRFYGDEVKVDSYAPGFGTSHPAQPRLYHQPGVSDLRKKK